jgi:hypothetical protein
MEGSMDRTTFYRNATQADRLEYRKWVQRVSVFYGLLVLAGISFAVARQYQSPQDAVAAATPTKAVAIFDQVKR